MPRPLVAAEGWTADGDFARTPGASDEQTVPPAFMADPAFRLWQALGSQDKPAHGTVVSAPFAMPPFLAVPYAGFPDEVDGNRIVLQCVKSGAEHPVSRFRMNDQRATSFLAPPRDFCDGPVRVVASVNGFGFMAVGTPFEVTEAAYRGQTEMFPRAMIVVASWAMVLGLWFVSAFVISRLTPAVGAVSSGMIGAAVLGMILIAAFTAGPSAGKMAVWVVAGGGAIATIGIAIGDRRWSRGFLNQVWLPASLWLLVALFGAGVVTAADNGGGSWWINAVFTPLRWSSDNQLPWLLAEALFRGDPAADIHWGPWLATDRTPLLSAFLLAARILVIAPAERGFGPTFVPIAYMMSSIVFLSAWVAVLVELIRRTDGKLLAATLIIACTTPFLFFNSVYAWPKLLGAAYVLAGFGLLFDLSVRRSREPAVLVLASLCAMAACLAHSSNVFGLVPIALLFVPTIWRQGPAAILLAVLAAIALASPWLYWQAFIQPGGNALLRFAFAFDFDANNRSRTILSAVRDAYSDMTLESWLRGKWSSIALMLGIDAPDFGVPEMATRSAGAGWIGWARVNDFLSVGHALAASSLGLLAVPLMGLYARGHRPAATLARWSALAGVSGVLFGLLVMLPPGIVHHQPYGSLLLMVMAGALAIAAAPAWLRAATTALATGYFAVVWVWHPIATAVTVHGSAVLLIAWSAAAIGWLLLMRPDDASSPGSVVRTA